MSSGRRVQCGECGHEYLLPYSFKRRHYRPLCQKQVVESGEYVCGEVLKKAPSPLCLQHSQDPSTLFPLRPFATFGTESLCSGDLEGVSWRRFHNGIERPARSLRSRHKGIFWGKQKKQNRDEGIPCILEPEDSPKEYRKNWAKLIQKICEIGPNGFLTHILYAFPAIQGISAGANIFTGQSYLSSCSVRASPRLNCSAKS